MISIVRDPAVGDDLRLLLESIVDYAVFMLDTDGLVRRWNAGAVRLQGYEPSEIIGAHHSKLYASEDVAAGKPELDLANARRAGRVESVGWRLRKNGGRFWASAVITAMRDECGTLVGFAGVTRELSNGGEAERKLLETEERFRLLVENVTDYAIYMLDREGRVTTWNLGAQRMKGYLAEEVLGRSFERFFSEEDRAAGKPARELRRALASGRFEDEGWRVRKDGTRFWANVVLTPVRDACGEHLGFAKVTRDLTARREAEETERRLLREQVARAAAESNERRLRESEQLARAAAERAREEARRADEAARVKDEFLATVSHELRTPLNAIVGWSSLLCARATDPSIADGIAAIHRNAQAQARIVDDILDVSRIITGKLRLELGPVDLSAIVLEALEVVRPSAHAKRIALEFSPPRRPAMIVGDPERLRQVMWNLLSNAIKFTDRDGSVVTWIDRASSRFAVSVRDTGRGIEPELLPHVFERFRQADSSTTRHYGGLGLGLAIVRHIVELHGGEVEAESAGRGHGARFTFTLPVRAVVPADELSAPGASPSSPLAQACSLSGMRILVVDDDEDARTLVQCVLAEAGAEVRTVESVAAGLDVLPEFRPDVLVSDIGLPNEDGYSFARRIRNLPREQGGGIPTVALTAYARDEDRLAAMAAGFTAHIGKPVDPETLVVSIARAAARSRH